MLYEVITGDLPAADFTDFFSAAGGTLEYNGSSSIDILTDLPVINSLKLSGTGTRKFPNINVQLLGGLTINGPVVDNDTYDKAISIKKNIVFDAGTFTAGNLSTAKVILNGTAAQTIGGTASFTTVTNDFNHLEINNTAGVTLNKPVDISGDLTLTAGVLTTTATNVLKLTSATATATGGKSTAYVSGPLVKQVSSGNSFTFPIGKGARYGALGLTTVSQTGLWKAEYFNNSPQNEGYNPASVVAPMASVSRNEYWNVLAPAAATAGLTMRWDANSGVDPASSDMRATQYITTAWNQVALGTKTGNASGGSAPLAAAMSFNANAGGNYITFGSISLPAFSWIGTTSDWFTASNWNNAILPTATSNVTINTVVGPKVYPVIDPAINASLVQVKDLAIDPGATLTLMPGSKMTVNGNVTGADNSLIVQNTNLKPSSFINLGTVTPKVQVEWTYINGLQFWYIGHSVNGAIASDYGVLTGASRDVALYKWPTNWTGNTITTDATPLNETLMGYVAYFKNANTKVTTRGALNSGDITLTPMAAAWHLVANPYASYIDLDNTSQWDFGQALNSTWITTDITPGVRGFATYNVTLGIGANGGTGNVAPGQSFWIRTYTANDAFTIKSGARVHGAGALKSAKVNANDIFRLTIGNKVSQDELVMAFRSEGSDEVGVADSEKRLQAAANYPQVYSLKGEQSLAINTLPELNEDKVVPLGYLPVANEAIVIKATNLATFNPEVSVELEDKETGLFYDLRAVESVSVANSGAVANDERFALHFSRASKVPSNTTTTEIGEISKNDISITSAENKVVVEIKGDDTQQGVNVKMYAITGEKIIYDSFKGGYKQYALPTKSGHYVVSVTAKNAQGKTIEKRALVAVKNK